MTLAEALAVVEKRRCADIGKDGYPPHEKKRMRVEMDAITRSSAFKKFLESVNFLVASGMPLEDALVGVLCTAVRYGIDVGRLQPQSEPATKQ